MRGYSTRRILIFSVLLRALSGASTKTGILRVRRFHLPRNGYGHIICGKWKERTVRWITFGTSVAICGVCLASSATGGPRSVGAENEMADITNLQSRVRELEKHGAMKTDFVSRADYGDLGKASEFQECFYASMDKWFGIGDSDFGAARSARLEAKGVSLVQSFKNTIAVDVTFKSADGEKDGGADIDDEMSANDVERNFDAKCLELLAAQTDDESKVGNLARSEGMFRTAMRAWLREALPDIPETGRYKIFLTDAAKAKDGASKFLSAVTAALKEYAPIRKKNVESRKKKAEAIPSVTFLLKSSYEYSAACEIYRNAEGVEPNLSVVKPLYLLPAYNGRENETAFIEFLESQTDKIEWWFKNGSEGKDAFGLKYFNTTYQEDRLFYPDWIVKFKDGRIGIFDTKAGATAVNPEGREMGLRNKIAAMNKAAGRALFFGGLVVRENGLWHYHEGKDYSYTPGGIGAGWKQLWF